MKWTPENMPSQRGRVAIVTGANSGIGFETARQFAAKGAHVVLACRNAERGQAALDRLRSENLEGELELLLLDLADLSTVEAFASSFRRRHDCLDLLINNAGVMVPPFGRTKDGFETQFGANHLGHFALTAHLMGLILATPESRIVNVTSTAHWFGRMDFANLGAEKGYKPWPAYGQSKLANLLFTFELQRRLEALGSTTQVLAAHPGWTATELQRNASAASILNRYFAQAPEMGALPTLRAATDPRPRAVRSMDRMGGSKWPGTPSRRGTRSGAEAAKTRPNSSPLRKR